MRTICLLMLACSFTGFVTPLWAQFSTVYDFENINQSAFASNCGPDKVAKAQMSNLYLCRELANFAKNGSFSAEITLGVNNQVVLAKKVSYTPFEVQVGAQSFKLRMLIIRPNDLEDRPCILLSAGNGGNIENWYNLLVLGVADYVSRGYAVALYENFNSFTVNQALSQNPGASVNLPVFSDPELPFYALFQFARAAAKYISANAGSNHIAAQHLFAGGHSAGGFSAYSLALSDQNNFTHPAFDVLGDRDARVFADYKNVTYHINGVGILGSGLFLPNAKMGDLITPDDTAKTFVLWHGANDLDITPYSCPNTPCNSTSPNGLAIQGAVLVGERLCCAGAAPQVFVHCQGKHRVIKPYFLNNHILDATFIEQVKFGPDCSQTILLTDFLIKANQETLQLMEIQSSFAKAFKAHMVGATAGNCQFLGQKFQESGNGGQIITDNTCIMTPNPVSVSFSTSNGCYYGQGAASCLVSGGTGAFQYNWSTGDTSSTVSDLVPGTYTVTITTETGCKVVENIQIKLVAPLEMSASSSPSCIDPPNGFIQVWATGGTAPYSFLWNNGLTTSNAWQQAPGAYTITATDSEGCTAWIPINVDLKSSPILTLDTKPSCFGQQDGIVSALVNSGVFPFQFKWNTGASTQTIENLSEGLYIVTVVAGNGCQTTDTAHIAENPAIELSISMADSLGNCVANATATGGAPPYQFMWNQGQIGSQQVLLASGAFMVTVTDAAGCTQTVERNCSVATVELNNAKFTLSPNPNSGIFTLLLNLQPSRPLSLALYNLRGEMVCENLNQDETGRVQLEDLSPGTYFLQGVYDGSAFCVPVVISK